MGHRPLSSAFSRRIICPLSKINLFQIFWFGQEILFPSPLVSVGLCPIGNRRRWPLSLP